ncbi:sigma-70 family RNA polymerase sigma factor [Metabacillus halosaccharovorans]|uniref:sigma-70 family RNA polymerase sigma factor n=1 Tax=Metabacillus halosaccharovorans TaxID=930124 RepID=UPI000994CA98|nr:sigma-70 family RNA polymerase sigma factor [Metabacillus halosaccharovorans]
MKSKGEVYYQDLNNTHADDLDLILNELMEQHGTELTRLAFTYTKNAETAKDIVQNVFIKCYKNLHTFKGNATIKTWLYSITINQCKDYLRSSYFRRVVPIGMRHTDNPKSSSTEKIVLQNNTKQQVDECINKLSAKYKDVIYLYYVQELSLKETGAILGLSIDTVKTRLRRAKEKLKPILQKEDVFYD